MATLTFDKLSFASKTTPKDPCDRKFSNSYLPFKTTTSSLFLMEFTIEFLSFNSEYFGSVGAWQVVPVVPTALAYVPVGFVIFC